MSLSVEGYSALASQYTLCVRKRHNFPFQKIRRQRTKPSEKEGKIGWRVSVSHWFTVFTLSVPGSFPLPSLSASDRHVRLAVYTESTVGKTAFINVALK